MEILKPEEYPDKIIQFETYLIRKGLSRRYIRLTINVIKRYFLEYGVFELEFVNEFLTPAIDENLIKRSYCKKPAFINFLTFLDREELIKKLPRIKQLPNKTSGNLYPLDKLKEAINAMDDPVYRLCALIQLDSGLRSFEVIKLRREDIKYDKDGDLWLYVIGKGGVAKSFYVSKATEELLKDYMEYNHNSYLFLKSDSEGIERAIDTNTRYYRKFLSKAIKNVFGVPKLTTHDFRRNLGASVYEKTHDIKAVQEMLDHKLISTTERYIKGITTDKKKMIRQIRG